MPMASALTLTEDKEKWRKKIREFDGFPKVDETFLESSYYGGLATILLCVLLAILLVGNVSDFLTINPSHEFLVDNTVSRTIEINMDVAVAMPCADIAVGTSDSFGQLVLHNPKVKMTPIDYENFDHKFAHINSIMESLNVFKHLPQISFGLKKDGCHIMGSIEVNKVSGKLQYSLLHRAHVHPDGRLHDETSKKMNFSHRIVHLSFGTRQHSNLGIGNPLDGAHEHAPQEHYNYQYFLSVVPTILVKAGGRTFVTSQFAVTNYSDPIDDQDRHGSSGIYLSYSFEPISVRITENNKSFISFVVQTCAILGGIFTSTQMINRLFESIMNFRTNQEY